MNTRLTVMKRFIDKHHMTILFLGFILLYAGVTLASTSGNTSTGNDAAFEKGYNWFMSVFKGKLGVFLAAIAFVIGLIWGIVKQAPMAVVGGIVFALLIAFGVDMATGIVNSSLVGQVTDYHLIASLISFMIVLSIRGAISAKHSLHEMQFSKSL